MTANGLNEYDFGARQYYTAVPGFTRIDPMAEKYPWLSPYLYCANNPVNAIDPDGRSTWVKDLGDGQYEILGGDLDDNDLNIYIYTQDSTGEYTVRGESIGETPLITTFFNSGEVEGDTGNWAVGAIINTNDTSGEEFFANLVNENPPLDEYMQNAQNGGKYDFKSTSDQGSMIKTNYRGMPFGTNENGTRLYASARDIGNIGAGYMAGVNGIHWKIARMGFDAYQSIKKGMPVKESISSQNAQRYGHTFGSSKPLRQRVYNLGRSIIKSFHHLINR